MKIMWFGEPIGGQDPSIWRPHFAEFQPATEEEATQRQVHNQDRIHRLMVSESGTPLFREVSSVLLGQLTAEMRGQYEAELQAIKDPRSGIQVVPSKT